ncbi:MAG TPA: hypothetical protein VIO15_13660 [Bacteroidales bacterium]
MEINRYDIYRQIMWDYNISPQEIDAVLSGNSVKAGHYTKQTIFIKLLENLPWFTLVRLFSVTELKQMLTDEVIDKLRFKSLRGQYKYVQQRLQ